MEETEHDLPAARQIRRIISTTARRSKPCRPMILQVVPVQYILTALIITSNVEFPSFPLCDAFTTSLLKSVIITPASIKISHLNPLKSLKTTTSLGASKSRKKYSTSRNNKQQADRRWEMPLTSKPFQGVEELQSTVRQCLVALAVYFAIGTCVFPFLLEPSWTVIDALYFSMTTLTTVAYGDVVVSGGTGLRATLGKLFLLSFNIYAVCISVSALGIIAKLAMVQERKIIKQARKRARDRDRLVRLFSDEEEDDDEEENEHVREGDDADSEDCAWADNIYLDKCDDGEQPQTMMGTLRQSLQRHAVNFVALVGLASLLGKVEKWSLVDIIYFWNCTATTMGYGDIAPQTQIGRLLAVVFIPLAVISLGEVIGK